MKNKLEKLVRRLKKIGIEVEIGLNYPWVMLDFVNGKRVTETFWSDHGYTVCFMTGDKFLNLRYLFKILRKYK